MTDPKLSLAEAGAVFNAVAAWVESFQGIEQVNVEQLPTLLDELEEAIRKMKLAFKK